jgi:hypothetical protein
MVDHDVRNTATRVITAAGPPTCDVIRALSSDEFNEFNADR